MGGQQHWIGEVPRCPPGNSELDGRQLPWNSNFRPIIYPEEKSLATNKLINIAVMIPAIHINVDILLTGAVSCFLRASIPRHPQSPQRYTL
jgi:hypothetical protein